MCCFIFDRNLRSIIAEYILPSRDPMIGLQFSTSSALFPGLGISVVRLIFHCAGYIRCSMRRLHSLANTCSAPFFLRWNYFIWSAPAAVSDLIFLNFSTRLSRAIGVQISLISILLRIGWSLCGFSGPIWPHRLLYSGPTESASGRLTTCLPLLDLSLIHI